MLAFLLALVSLLFDSPGSPPAPIDGYTVASPSGAFELFVLPDDRKAQAGAEYVLSKAGHVLWNVHHDFALREAYVTDAGVSGGFALTDSKGTPARASGSYLVVATLAEDGTLRHSEWTATFSPPDPAPSMTPPPQVPLVSGMQVLPNAGRMILALDVRGLYWRAYDTTTGERVALGTGERVALGAAEDGGDAPVVDGLEHSDHPLGFDGLKRGAFEPKVSAEAYVGDVLLASEHRSEELVEVVVLAGVDMVLERWLVSNGYETPRSEVVNLLDGEGRCIFRQVSRSVYPSLGEIGPWTFDAGRASNFVVDAEGTRFTKRRWVSAGEFQIEGTWEVRSINAQDARALEWELVPVAEPVSIPPVAAPYDPTASALQLEWIDSQRAPFDVVGAELVDGVWVGQGLFDGALVWQVEADGELVIVRHDAEGVLTCTRYGAGLETVDQDVLDVPDFWQLMEADPADCSATGHTTKWFAVGEGRWLVRGQGLSFGVVDVQAGTFRTAQLDALAKAVGEKALENVSIESAFGLPGSGLVLNTESVLLALDAELELDWFVRNSSERVIGSLWDTITTMKDGRVVALVDDAGLQVWNANGRDQGWIQLPEKSPLTGLSMWFTEVRPWGANEVLLTNFRAEGSSMVVDLTTGAVRLVAFGGERYFGELQGEALQSMPSGATWIRERNALHRLDLNGVVVESRRNHELGMQEPLACAVLRDGRVAVYDALVARLSIWDPTSGAVLHVDASGADGFGLDEDPRLAELADGRVRIDLDFAMDAYPELTWSPGSPTLERRTTADAFVRTPDGRFEWEWRYPGIIEVRTTEGAPVRTIERHGKGLWFNGVSSIWFAADGSVWVKEGSSGLTSHAPHLVHYTPDGTELDAQLDYGLWPLASGVVFDGALAVGSRGSSKSVLIENPTSAFPKLHELLDLPTGPATLPDNAPGELWLFELETLSLHRYKLPAELSGL